MNVLVFNCGSSSLKYRLICLPQEVELAGGEAERIGPPTAKPARIVHRVAGRQTVYVVPMPNHRAAFQEVMKVLEKESLPAPDAVGHRLVHGGSQFPGHVVIGPSEIRRLAKIGDLAPIHNPPAIALVHACRELYPGLPQALVFDTAFHSTIPEYARTYALPRRLRVGMGFRKYGFHGTSHQFVSEEAARFLGLPPDRLNAVSCHLGSGGASLCAIAGGRSVDNTMGYTPLQGLIMSTRCGDLDPGLALNLLSLAGGDAKALESMLNTRSGVLGLSGFSADIRDLLASDGKAADSDRARAASAVYLWRIRKYLGAYLSVVGAADAVIFTDTIGETVPAVRSAVCANMEFFGLKMDPERNAQATRLPADVAAPESRVRILVIATNEELAIARRTYALLGLKGVAA